MYQPGWNPNTYLVYVVSSSCLDQVIFLQGIDNETVRTEMKKETKKQKD